MKLNDLLNAFGKFAYSVRKTLDFQLLLDFSFQIKTCLKKIYFKYKILKIISYFCVIKAII